MIHTVRWTSQKIAQRLLIIEPLVYRRSQPLPPFRYTTLSNPVEVPPVDLDIDDTSWEVIHANTYWGQWVTDFALRGEFRVPEDWAPDAPVALYLPLGDAGEFTHPEALTYIDGVPYAACDRYHQEILLPAKWRDGRDHRLVLHGWTGFCGLELPRSGTRLLMGGCAVVQIDQPTRDFVATARVALGIADSVDPDHPARGHLLNALDESFKLLDIRTPLGERFYESVEQAHAVLQSGIAKAGPPMDVTITATGHAHLDVAWLWTVGQIRRKAGRTFHTVMRLMEQFPDFHFTQSQPQIYDFIRQDYPELFSAIKERVAEDRWEPIGGMWVEADCNLSGPESLARQLLLGRTFYQEHFGPGAESPVLWLPDVFGYAWALPQLIKQSGLEYFCTIKIGWSQYNRLPYDTFWWQGLDGTRVLTHFSTAPDLKGYGVSTYNAEVTPGQVIGTWTTFQQKEIQQSLLMTFGHGDGGGGPTREMLENIREMAAFPATPSIRQANVGDFFRDLETTSGERLPVWNGELYLELHRGTYTSQSRNKRANRKSEFLLHDAEFLATFASLLDPGYTYPWAALRKAWELVCLNQFHDIIPGSSIGQVYIESQQQYEEIYQTTTAVRAAALEVISSQIDERQVDDTPVKLFIANPTSFARTDLVFWSGRLPEGKQLRRSDGAPVLTQAAIDGIWIDAGELEPLSVTPLAVTDGQPLVQDTGLIVTPTLLENATFRVEFNQDGDITRIYDKAYQREVLLAGALANQFQAFEDIPLSWDAWDTEIFYDDKMWVSDPATLVRVVEAGPLRATLEVQRRILNSDYVQRISLVYNQPRLDFDTYIKWQERRILLKVAFPVDILAPAATYEVQWGNVQRPTHRNTSWDWARFETCAQKWVDLSEGGYGVSLLNDCKYGHDVHDNILRITLLRSPTIPDPDADLGEHRFVYSLLPHSGGLDERTIAAAYALNDPSIVFENNARLARKDVRSYSVDPSASFISCAEPNIVIETIKQAEDGQGIIVRFYECQRRRGMVNLKAGFKLEGAWRTNLLEENQTALAPDGQDLSLFVRPFEIVTLRLVPAARSFTIHQTH